MPKKAATPDMVLEPSPLAENLTRILRARGIKPTQLARDAGLNQSTISRICSGERAYCSQRTLSAIANALDVDVEDLTGEPKRQRGTLPVPIAHEPAAPYDDEAMGETDGAELLSLYMVSEYAREDRPTAEEIRWLLARSFVWTGRPPTAKTASKAIHRYRARQGR